MNTFEGLDFILRQFAKGNDRQVAIQKIDTVAKSLPKIANWNNVNQNALFRDLYDDLYHSYMGGRWDNWNPPVHDLIKKHSIG